MRTNLQSTWKRDRLVSLAMFGISLAACFSFGYLAVRAHEEFLAVLGAAVAIIMLILNGFWLAVRSDRERQQKAQGQEQETTI